jgi:uncharacterized LabA/DUF88 family protein
VKKIAVFADVQNIYYTTRQIYGRQFNYRKLWQRLSSEGEIVSATAYATHRGDDKQLKFQDALKHIGFLVKLKPYIQRSDGSAKGDWDVGITIDVMEAAKSVDSIVLLSGDGDFDLLLEKIKKDYAVTAEVYGVPELTANSLIESANIYHPIEDDLIQSLDYQEMTTIQAQSLPAILEGIERGVLHSKTTMPGTGGRIMATGFPCTGLARRS